MGVLVDLHGGIWDKQDITRPHTRKISYLISSLYSGNILYLVHVSSYTQACVGNLNVLCCVKVVHLCLTGSLVRDKPPCSLTLSCTSWWCIISEFHCVCLSDSLESCAAYCLRSNELELTSAFYSHIPYNCRRFWSSSYCCH